MIGFTRTARARSNDGPGPVDAVTLYDSSAEGTPAASQARELWRFRHLVAELIRRDIKIRYKRSVLGVFWTLLSPLFQMAALAWVFSIVLRQPAIENFPGYYFSGVVFWTFFSQSTGHAASLTIEASEMGRRVFVPRSAFVAAAVGSGVVNLLLSLVPLVVILVATRHPFSASWAFLPAAIAISVFFTLGVALVVFTYASRFVDVRETYLVLLQPLFFLTPILYHPSMVPDGYRWMVRFNPLTYVLEMYRAPIYYGWLPGWKSLTFAIVVSLGTFLAGWWFHASRIERYGRD